MSENNIERKENLNTDNRKKNPNVKYIFNIIILAGLIVLYILFFLSKDDKEIMKPDQANDPHINQKTSSVIAFVNTDLIMDNYELVKNMRKNLNEKMDKMEAEIKSKQDSYEKDAAYFQEQVAKQSISEKSAQLIYEKLMDEQQKLIDLRDKYSDQLAMEEYEMNVILVDSITNFLQRYNVQHNYDYVLGYTKGGGILLAKDTFDITQVVLAAMNNEYLNKQE